MMDSRRELSSLSRSDRRLSWARRQLGVPADATPEQVQARFLTIVEEDDFVPDESVQTAYRMLPSGAGGLVQQHEPREFLLAEEELLTEEVEQFAEQMFELPLPERRRRWTELHSRSHLALRPRGRLESLSAGLKADLSVVDNIDRVSVRLADHLCELFLLLPVARATRRAQILDELKNDQTISNRAVRRFQSRYADLAAMDPDLLSQLIGHPTHAKQVAKARRRRRREPPVVAKSQSSGGTPWWLIGVVLVVASSVGRLVTVDNRSPSRPPPTSTYSPEFNEKMQSIITDLERQRTDTDTDSQRMLEAIRRLREPPAGDMKPAVEPKQPFVNPLPRPPDVPTKKSSVARDSRPENRPE